MDKGRAREGEGEREEEEQKDRRGGGKEATGRTEGA